VYPADVPTVMSQLDGAGLTWRAYEDGMGVDPTRDNTVSGDCGHPVVGTADDTEGGESAAPFDGTPRGTTRSSTSITSSTTRPSATRTSSH